jgi:phage repressor protein C with HTH and peptisase S24 domain
MAYRVISAPQTRYIWRMSDLATRIRQRLEALDLSARRAAQLAGGSESMVRNILVGASESPRAETISKLAPVLQVSEQWLMTGEDARPMPPGDSSEFRMADPASAESLRNLPKDVPVLGTVAGSELGKGAFQLTTDIVDYVRRPFGLLGAADIYALYVEGESMVPKFEPGDLVFVHPHRKARPGDYVVIQEPDTDRGEPRGFIKRLVSTTSRLVKTQQFNPRASIDFVIRPGLVVHKVMTDGELYGV